MPDTTRDPRAWIAPLVCTLVTLPMGLVALFIGGLTPMACDPCDGAEAARFDASFAPAWTVLCVGLLLTAMVLVASWSMPWQMRNTARRVVLSLAAPATTMVTFVAFMALVDWP